MTRNHSDRHDKKSLNTLPKPQRGDSANGGGPRYAELARQLRHLITTNGMKPGQRLGTESELAQKHGVSRVTVRAALSILEQEGHIDRKRALGTFIRRVGASKRHGSSSKAPGQPPTASRNGTVVFVCHTDEPTHPYENFSFVTMLRAFERVLRKDRFNLQIMGLDSDATVNRNRLHDLVHHAEACGFCFVPIWSVNLEEYEEYCSWLPADVPSVLCNGYDLGRPDCVARAMETGCRKLMDLLVANGHRDIAMLSSPIFSPQEYAIHAASYIGAFESRRLTLERSLIYKGYPGESLRTLVLGALTGRIRPTAVFASDARVCETVFAVARELGLRIPVDLSLVGYGDNVLHIPSPVPVTAYAVQNKSLAENAARLLVDLIRGRRSNRSSLVIPGKLIEGATVRRL